MGKFNDLIDLMPRVTVTKLYHLISPDFSIVKNKETQPRYLHQIGFKPAESGQIALLSFLRFRNKSMIAK